MQSFIPQQIANKLVFVVCLLFYSTGAGQERSGNKGCVAGYRYSNAENTNPSHCVKVTLLDTRHTAI